MINAGSHAHRAWQIRAQRTVSPYLKRITLPFFVLFALLYANQIFSERPAWALVLVSGLVAIVLLGLNLWSLTISTAERLPAAATPEELAAFERTQATFLDSIKGDLERKAKRHIAEIAGNFNSVFVESVKTEVESKFNNELLKNLDARLTSEIGDSASKARIMRVINDRSAQIPIRYLDFANRAERTATRYQLAAALFAIVGVGAASARLLGVALPTDDWVVALSRSANEKNMVWIFAIRNAPIVALVVLVESLALIFLRQSTKEIERTRFFVEEATRMDRKLVGAALALERGTSKDISLAASSLMHDAPSLGWAGLKGVESATVEAATLGEKILHGLEMVRSRLDKVWPGEPDRSDSKRNAGSQSPPS